MISGVTSGIKNLSGKITAEETLKASISGSESLIGNISVSVRDVPYYETDNSSGGITVYIGKEIVNNGI